MGKGRTHVVLSRAVLLACCACLFASSPSVDVTQYVDTAWTSPDGFLLGSIYAMAQRPVGYLWLGSEFGLFRFDGVHAVPWQPPGGQHLSQKPYSLLVTRDGTLWIGTFASLESWNWRQAEPVPGAW